MSAAQQIPTESEDYRRGMIAGWENAVAVMIATIETRRKSWLGANASLPNAEARAVEDDQLYLACKFLIDREKFASLSLAEDTNAIKKTIATELFPLVHALNNKCAEWQMGEEGNGKVAAGYLYAGQKLHDVTINILRKVTLIELEREQKKGRK